MTLTYGDVALSINGHSKSIYYTYYYFSIPSELLNNYKIKNQTIAELIGQSNLHLSSVAIETLGGETYLDASEVLTKMQTINNSIFNSSNYSNFIDTNNTNNDNYSHTFYLSAMLSFDSATFYDGSDTSNEEVIDIQNYPTLSTCLGMQFYNAPLSYDILQWFSPPKYTDFSDGTYNVPSNVNKVSFILIGGGGGGSRTYLSRYIKTPYFNRTTYTPLFTSSSESGYIGIKTIDVSENDTLTYTIGLAGTNGGNNTVASTTYYQPTGSDWTTDNSNLGTSYQTRTGYTSNLNTGGGDTSLIHTKNSDNSETTYMVSGGWAPRPLFEMNDPSPANGPDFTLKYYDANGDFKGTGDNQNGGSITRSLDDVHTNMDYITNSVDVVREYQRSNFYPGQNTSTSNTSIYYSPGSKYKSSVNYSSQGITSTSHTSGNGMIVIIPHYS